MLRFPARDVDYGEAGLAWSHSYNDDWSHYLGGGLLGVKVPTELETEYYMAVHTALTYLTATGGTIALNFDRGVYTNVFVGDVLLQTGGGLHGTQFFGRGEAWSATVGLDYQHSKSLLYVDVNESRLDVVSAIALVTWDWTRHKRWLFELTYTYQDSDEAIRNRRVVGPLKLNHFMAMATLEFSFPEQDEEAQQRAARPCAGAWRWPQHRHHRQRPGRTGWGRCRRRGRVDPDRLPHVGRSHRRGRWHAQRRADALSRYSAVSSGRGGRS